MKIIVLSDKTEDQAHADKLEAIANAFFAKHKEIDAMLNKDCIEYGEIQQSTMDYVMSLIMEEK